MPVLVGASSNLQLSIAMVGFNDALGIAVLERPVKSTLPISLATCASSYAATAIVSGFVSV